MKSIKKEYKGTVTKIIQIAHDVYTIDISSDLFFCCPGQFISVLCPNITLRRPFSIADFSAKEKKLTILFKLKGMGTEYLSGLREGDKINFLAPLGNGFEIKNKKSLLVGAGIGIAPLLFLKKEMDKKNIENFLISGFKKKNEIIEGSDENVIGGSVLDNIDKVVKEKKFEIIYSCGPTPVLYGISQIAQKNNIPCYLALERIMACSIGVCRGCVIKLIRHDEILHVSVCKDGPVFLGSEIVWD